MSEKADAVAQLLRDQFLPGDRVVVVNFNLRCTVIARWDPDNHGQSLEAYVVRYASGGTGVYAAAYLRLDE